jgi:outer membrane protein TolC
VTVLAGCAVTAPPPPEQIRTDALQGTEIRASWSAGAAEAGAISDNWLLSFNDPQLNALVSEAIARNPDLRATAARVEQSAAYAQIARAALLPAINLLGTGGFKAGGGSDLTSALQGVMLGVSWEPDLWGRLRYGRNAADETYASAQADYEFARQSMAAQVARSWFMATETRLQLAAAESMAQSSQDLLRLAEDRQRVGVGSHKDVALARANLGTFEDAVRQSRLAHEQAVRSLEMLLGRYPSTELQAAPALPTFPGPVPVGMPLDMLERRPDIVAAERRVAAAFDRVARQRRHRAPGRLREPDGRRRWHDLRAALPRRSASSPGLGAHRGTEGSAGALREPGAAGNQRGRERPRSVAGAVGTRAAARPRARRPGADAAV